MIRKYYLLSFVLGISCAHGQGQFTDDMDEFGDFYTDSDFISIATGSKKQISKAPSVTAVITAAQIAKMGANSIHQILQSVTGIHVYPSNFNRMNPSYSIRGIHTSQNPQVLVLVNGQKTRSNWTGAKWDLFNIGVNTIQRIEIIKGPGSAVHGADAFSGVVNIITKGFESDAETDAGLTLGSFSSRNVWANITTQIYDTRFYLNAQINTTDGDSSRIVKEDVLYSLGLSEISNAPSALDTDLNTIDIHAGFAGNEFYGSVWYLENKGGNGAGGAQALSLNDYTHSKSFTASIGYKKKVNETLNLEVLASYQNLKQDSYFTIFPKGMPLPRAFDPDTGAPSAFTIFTDGVIGQPILLDDNYSSELIVHYTGFNNHKIRTSIGYLKNEMDAEEWKNFGPIAQDFDKDFRDGALTNVTDTPFIFSPNIDREVYYATIQDEWKFNKDWELTAGLRYDNYSDFGETYNPRLALVWQAEHNLTVKMLYGEAFRAPSIGELHAINNPIILGNPDLDAEKIDTFELAFDYRPNFDWKLQLSLFKYQANNLIVYIPQLDGTSQAENAAKQDGKGLEIEAQWNISSNIEVKFGLALQDSEDSINNNEIADAPQKMFDLSLNWKILPNLQLHLDSQIIKDRARLPNDTRLPIDNYVWTNANITYNIGTVDLSFAIRNLFDKAAYEPSDGQIPGDYPLEERGYWVTSRYRF